MLQKAHANDLYAYCRAYKVSGNNEDLILEAVAKISAALLLIGLVLPHLKLSEQQDIQVVHTMPYPPVVGSLPI